MEETLETSIALGNMEGNLSPMKYRGDTPAHKLFHFLLPFLKEIGIMF